MRTKFGRAARWMPPEKPAKPKPKSAIAVEDKTRKYVPAPYAEDWFLVMTDPKRELTAIDALIRAGYLAWAPQMRVFISSASVRKRLKVSRQLFPRYVFVSHRPGVTKPAKFCDHVSMLVQEGAIRAPWAVVRELSDRQAADEFDMTLIPPPSIVPGDAATFTIAGRLFEGVVQKAEEERVFMLVDLFGSRRVIEVREEMLTRAEKSA